MKKRIKKKRQKEAELALGVINGMTQMMLTGIQFFQVISGVRNRPPMKKPAELSSEIEDTEAEVISSTLKK